MMRTMIQLTREDFETLLEWASCHLETGEHEHSSPPTINERDFILSMYRKIGKELPESLKDVLKLAKS